MVQQKCFLPHPANLQSLSLSLMLHMFINAIVQEGVVISVSRKHVTVCK